MGRKNIKRNAKKGTNFIGTKSRYQAPSSYATTESSYNPNSYYIDNSAQVENAQKKLDNQHLIDDNELAIQKQGFAAEEKTVNSITMPGMVTRAGASMKTFNTARAGFNTAKLGAKSYEAAKLGFNVKKRMEIGESAWKLKQSMDRVRDVKNVGDVTKVATTGVNAGTAASTASKGSALGAGWKALGHAGKANLIGTAASFIGMGLKKTKFGNDGDDTTYKFGEGMSDVLQYGGQGAAWGSFLGPIGTGVGAVLGSAYGLWKGFRNRKKARNLKGNQDTRMEKLRGILQDRQSQSLLLKSTTSDTGRPILNAQ